MYTEKWTENSRDYIISGPSGAGKTYFIENEVLPELFKGQDENINYVERFFISKYSSYEELFGGYMPIDLEKDGNISYDFIPGPLAYILKKAYIYPDKNFVMIIDNLTNGNFYEVLGNFFQLFDRKKIAGEENWNKKNSSEYDISLPEEAVNWLLKDDEDGRQLSETAQERMKNNGNKVFLPDNLFMICTVNTSHRTRYLLDTAFKRRFKIVYINDAGEVYGNIPNLYTGSEVSYDKENDYISREKWNAIRKRINDLIGDITNVEDKQLTEHFISFTEDDKIARMDFINVVVPHLIDIEKRYSQYVLIAKEYTDFENVIKSYAKLVDIFADEELKNMLMNKGERVGDGN